MLNDSLMMFPVAEGFPIKQGLKLGQSWFKIKASAVAEGFPIKQGLKPVLNQNFFLKYLTLQKDFQ